jgi:hypothetical protein
MAYNSNSVVWVAGICCQNYRVVPISNFCLDVATMELDVFQVWAI